MNINNLQMLIRLTCPPARSYYISLKLCRLIFMHVAQRQPSQFTKCNPIRTSRALNEAVAEPAGINGSVAFLVGRCSPLDYPSATMIFQRCSSMDADFESSDVQAQFINIQYSILIALLCRRLPTLILSFRTSRCRDICLAPRTNASLCSFALCHLDC